MGRYFNRYLLGKDNEPTLNHSGDGNRVTIKLKNGIDYKYTELSKKYTFNKKTGELKVDLKYKLQCFGNYMGSETSTYTYETKILNLKNRMLDDSDIGIGYYDYNKINKELNGALDDYIININDNSKIKLNNGEYVINKVIIPFDLSYKNTYDGKSYILWPDVDFTYKKSGNKYIITGINQYSGTRTITVK